MEWFKAKSEKDNNLFTANNYMLRVDKEKEERNCCNDNVSY